LTAINRSDASSRPFRPAVQTLPPNVSWRQVRAWSHPTTVSGFYENVPETVWRLS